MSGFDYDRYNGTKRREVARRPIEAIVADAEAKAFAQMIGRAREIKVAVESRRLPTHLKLDFSPDWNGKAETKASPAIEPSKTNVGPAAPLPACVVGIRVRCLDVDCPEIFGEEAEVTRVHETGAFSVRSDRGPDAWTASSCSSWLRTVFPCDASRLRPSVGMHVSLALDERNTFVKEMVRVETGELLVIEGVWQFCEGVVDSESRHRFVFSKEHWLRRVWPDRLRGRS